MSGSSFASSVEDSVGTLSSATVASTSVDILEFNIAESQITREDFNITYYKDGSDKMDINDRRQE